MRLTKQAEVTEAIALRKQWLYILLNKHVHKDDKLSRVFRNVALQETVHTLFLFPCFFV